MGICDGRTVAITGAGRGIGRGHALEFARQGAQVVVNDLGGAADGSGASPDPAHEVVEEIRALGGEAVANTDDITSWAGAQRLVATAVHTFGKLDVLVNNAGFIRDRMLVNMSESEWDAVVNVHLKGTFAPTRWAAVHWRERAKAGSPADARLISTSSPSGIFGNVGQANYGAAKAGIANLTATAALELERYGVTANAIAPAALTRMTDHMAAAHVDVEPGTFDPSSPDNIAPLVVWLGSEQSRSITGRVFLVVGGRITVADSWRRGPSVASDRRWDPSELGDVVPALVARARPVESKDTWAEAPPEEP